MLLLARLHRTALEHLRVRAQPKVTGRRGIQIWVPIAPGPGFDETRAWAEQLSVPSARWFLTWSAGSGMSASEAGLAQLNFYTQNVHNKTLVAPYSPRAAAGAPVSAPIEWDELDDPSLRPDAFSPIRNILPRVAERGDVFRTVLASDQILPPIS